MKTRTEKFCKKLFDAGYNKVIIEAVRPPEFWNRNRTMVIQQIKCYTKRKWPKPSCSDILTKLKLPITGMAHPGFCQYSVEHKVDEEFEAGTYTK